MLRLDNRQVLLAALSPPPEYVFDRGVCTTYALDLPTLLVTPLSLALLEVPDAEKALRDPVLLLEGLQRHAGQLSIFCQAGQIAIPTTDSYLFRFLQEIVIEVRAPHKGVFHPKVWLLRYTAPGRPVLYRFLCMTRNMTLDRSWDILVQLDGRLTERKYAYSKNYPLGNFIGVLPQLAVRPPNPRIKRDIELLAEEVRHVAFEPPPPFTEVAFHPSGIPGYRRLSLPPADRRLILSPFLSDGFLQEASAAGANHVLISRLESLDQIARSALAGFSQVFFFDDEHPGDPAAEPEQQAAADTATRPDGEARFSGLHAKLLVCNRGWYCTWLVGSANATDAAFRGRNVEFMVELRAKRKDAGVEQVLGQEGEEASLRAMLRDYRMLGDSRPEVPLKHAENLANAVRDWLISLELHIQVVQQGEDHYDLVLRSAGQQPPPAGDYTIQFWPISLPPVRRLSFPRTPGQEMVAFQGLSLLALTPFVAFEIAARADGQEHTLRFVLNLPVTGMPQQREDQVLAAIVSDRAAFLRYLRLLLADIGEDAPGRAVDWSDARGAFTTSLLGDVDVPLLESLLRALSRAPEKIDRAAALVEQIRGTPRGREILPEGFEALWEALQIARGRNRVD